MVVPELSWTLVNIQLLFCGFLSLQSLAWCTYREFFQRKLQRRGQICCADFLCNSLDEAPRPMAQYAYRSSKMGFFIMHCWTATLVVSYLLLIWGIWIAYVIFSDLYFPPSTSFWKEAFQTWDGVMFPWCVCFVLSHLCLVGVLIFWDAMRSQSMLPAASMAHATHIMVQETGDSSDTGRESKFCLFRSCFLVAQYLQQLRERQILPVQKANGKLYVEHMCVRYIYSERTQSFVVPSQPPPSPCKMHALLRSGGLTSQQAAERMEDSGLNAIHVRVPGVLESLVTEFSNFYYVFNSVGFLVYIAFTTWNIGLLWFLMTLGAGIYKGLIITRPNQRRVADLAKVKQRCMVLRDGCWQEMDASQIVLGDIVQVKGIGVEVPCDGLLISGSLIMNESMLTGEPMPVAKVAVQDVDSYDTKAKSNKIYAGTNVIESEGMDHALLFCTEVGALTTRGQLVRMVLFPANVRFKSVDQLPIVYGLMCVYAMVLVLFKTFFLNEGSGAVKFLSILCSFIGALSPMLPVSLVMGQSVSAKRLSRSEYQIKCLQPGRIPVAGKISTMVFDKTGTITKSGMDLSAVQPCEMAQFQPRVAVATDAAAEAPAALPEALQRALALCHTVKRLSDGRWVGNELECAMLRRSGVHGAELATSPVRELQFDHLSMTSGVVLRRGDVLETFVKGSPAMIKGKCRASSLPADYDSRVSQYAKANFYTISICHKILPEMSDHEVNEMPRAKLEQDLIFSGLLLFQNEMKQESPQAIEKLKEGAIRSVICTGDSELTGIAIGKQCGIVTGPCFHGHVDDGRLVFSDPEREDCPVDIEAAPNAQLALSRAAWLHLAARPELLQQLWRRCAVFGQMKPDDKIHVIKFLQSQDLIVGMAGDGGNDCGALRASHAGLALSRAEASLVAPFSSGRREAQSEEISLMTVPDLIREGRACLATNLATFSYFIVQALSIYSIMTVGMINCNVVFGEWVYIFKDVFLSMIMTFYMTRSRALPFLAKVRPTATLLGFRTICTISTQVVVNVAVFLVARALMYAQAWYDRLDPTNDIHILSHMWMLRADNYDGAITAICCLASLANVAYVNTYGGNFRRNICWNVGINVTYVLSMALVAVLTLAPPNPFNCLFRVNCDTPNSLASGMFPMVDEVSVGGVGECFIGPQVKPWQSYTLGYQTERWLPETEAKCLPPPRTLDALPLDHPVISSMDDCVGPNNCFSVEFKWMLMSLLILQSFIHHFFMKFVLLGPVARRLRKSHRKDVRGAMGFNPICPPKGDGDPSKASELASPKLTFDSTHDPQILSPPAAI